MNYASERTDEKYDGGFCRPDRTESSCSSMPEACSVETAKDEPGSIASSGVPIEGSHYFHIFPSDFNIFREVNSALFHIEDKQVRETTSKFLTTFQNIFVLNRERIQSSSQHLPPLRIRYLDDNSVLIEWIFKDFRIGFSIETQEDESSWYLISNSNLNETNAGGVLRRSEIESFLSTLLLVVLANA
jgi:hypothetical protein